MQEIPLPPILAAVGIDARYGDAHDCIATMQRELSVCLYCHASLTTWEAAPMHVVLRGTLTGGIAQPVTLVLCGTCRALARADKAKFIQGWRLESRVQTTLRTLVQRVQGKTVFILYGMSDRIVLAGIPKSEHADVLRLTFGETQAS